MFAPAVGLFFGDERAIGVTRALAVTLPILALGNTHDALLQKRMKFGTKAFPDTVKVVAKGVIAIGLAIQGFGYWSLIVGQIVGSLLWVIVLWWVVPWRPTFEFEFKELGPLLRYSLSIVTMSAFAIIFTNADYLFIGRYLGAGALGIYTLAFRLPELLIKEFPIMVGNVLLPAFSKMGTDADTIEANTLTSIRYSVLITLPIGIGLALTARPLVFAFLFRKVGRINSSDGVDCNPNDIGCTGLQFWHGLQSTRASGNSNASGILTYGYIATRRMVGSISIRDRDGSGANPCSCRMV